MPKSLRTLLPLVLLLLLLIASSINFYLKSNEFEKTLRLDSQEHLKAIGNLISANIETGIRYSLPSIVHSAIEQSQSTKLIRYSLIVDETNMIFSANHRELQGRPIYAIKEPEVSAFLTTLKRQFILKFTTPESPWLIYQIPLSRQSVDNTFANKLDRLVLVANISKQLESSAQQLIQEIIILGGISSLLTFMLWLILKVLVVSPVNQLKDLSLSIASGNMAKKQSKRFMSEFESLDLAMRKMAKKINDMERNYQELYDKNPATFITVDEELTIVNINEYGLEVTGYKKSDVIGIKACELYSPDDKTSMTHWELKRITKAKHLFWTRDGARLIKQFGKKFILIVSQDITDLHKLSQRLSYQASHDDLTGLINRAEFSRLLSMSLEKAQVQNICHCVCFLDLDQFKVVNDVCGHTAGDELLKQISTLFKQHLRKDDVLARIGGDEFGLLLESCDPEKALEIIQTLRMALDANRFNWQDKFFEVGMSAGISTIDKNSVDIQSALTEADSACYSAKDLDRGRTVIFNDSDENGSNLLGEMQWINKINQALESDNGFVLYFQKIMPLDFSKKNTFKGEVLIRMNIDNKIVPPGAFLPAAERYNLAYKIDLWVVKKTLSVLQKYKYLLPANWVVSINLSAQTVSSTAFNSKIYKLIKNNNNICRNLCFELTETAAMANFSNAIEFMHRVKKIGCGFSLDDFGSGFSSFGYLKKMPVNYVKIDGMFITDLAGNLIDQALVQSMNNIAHVLDKQTIAEFVENKESAEILHDINVDYGQGYYFHVPESFDEVLRRECAQLAYDSTQKK